MFKKLYRQLPPSIRQQIRIAMREVPIRLRDLPHDLADHGNPASLPPARLRARVGINSARAHYIDIGERASADVMAAFERTGATTRTHPSWLDFGCGAGRLARVITTLVPTVTGIDVHAEAVAWCRKHLKGDYRVAPSLPPTDLAATSIDVVYVISVFTHFDERQQFAWLEELHRILRPGGILIATTHSPTLTYNRPDLTTENHEELNATGFTARKGIGPFNEDSAFHSRAYLEREWTRYLTLEEFVPAGLTDYLDLHTWRR